MATSASLTWININVSAGALYYIMHADGSMLANNIELFASGTSKGKVCIGQASFGPAEGDCVGVKWDLGTSLEDTVYEI